MKMKTARSILLILFLIFVTNGYSQNSIDSVVMQYLRRVSGIPAPVVKIVKKNNKTLRSANFFIEPIDSLQYKEVKIKAFLFGSSVTHARKYFFVRTNWKGTTENKIIDNIKLENALTSLLKFIERWELPDADKAVLVRALTYAYN